jgi:YD repeat-containing protein
MITGSGTGCFVGLTYCGDRGLASQADDVDGFRGLVVAHDGSLILAHDHAIRRVFSVLPTFNDSDIAIAPDDGLDLYQFDGQGRHLRTINALTGRTEFEFAYDSVGRLIEIEDIGAHGKRIARRMAQARGLHGIERTGRKYDRSAGWLTR